ncbi:hypothetical protein [Streptomyces sp. NPDC006193]|uniref:hypothetical protein n=1 Tax=Streptomyces sp. NPDC006193 TaxID=3155717 RepID=UPI0033AE9715
MAHRPYPRLDRARRQVDRHTPKPPSASQPSAAEAGKRLGDFFRMAPRLGEYRISTR